MVDNCKVKHNGHILTIDSEIEWTLLKELLAQTQNNDWNQLVVGLQQASNDSTLYEWLHTGQTMNTTCHWWGRANVTYSCVVLANLMDMRMYDVPCTNMTAHGYICEMPIVDFKAYDLQ